MKQLLGSWNMLPAQKQIVLVLAVLASVVTVFGLVRLAVKPQLTVLYSGLDVTTLNEIVTALDKNGTIYEVRGNAVYVADTQRDRTRLALAGDGLPSNGISGYELLDGLSGFGTTSQMFDAAYWRAKEGELARTILATPGLSMARVHIANPVSRPFERGAKPTASVTVSTKNGALTVRQAEALRYLVAAAVSGLAPDQVTVIDTTYGVILQPGQDGGGMRGADKLDARAEALRANVERLLSARVGRGNAIVEVMVEARTQTETVTERTLDPNGAVPVSSQTENNTENSRGGAGNAVTVASNLPDTGNAGGSGTTSRNSVQSREVTSYDVSETVRERISKPGDIARLTVAVIVNGVYENDANGNPVYTPRSAEELSAFEALVKSTVGFRAERGDVVTIESLQFTSPPEPGTTATAGGAFSSLIPNAPMLVKIALLGMIATVLGLFVIRPILKNPSPQFARLAEDKMRELSGPESIIDGSAPVDNASVPALEQPSSDPVDILRDTIARRSDESGHLLRSWMESEPDNHEEVPG